MRCSQRLQELTARCSWFAQYKKYNPGAVYQRTTQCAMASLSAEVHREKAMAEANDVRIWALIPKFKIGRPE
jgi:hypothetical protein